jgi:hypothetical protein
MNEVIRCGGKGIRFLEKTGFHPESVLPIGDQHILKNA